MPLLCPSVLQTEDSLSVDLSNLSMFGEGAFLDFFCFLSLLGTSTILFKGNALLFLVTVSLPRALQLLLGEMRAF